ncbi:hypothetical protein [uncultured Planktosalinus sp.]|uniref:hypothetical protein n=1 Tax=uncultured Planktosalinus sp. TaxID=1810935 RepID=UPI0030DC9724
MKKGVIILLLIFISSSCDRLLTPKKTSEDFFKEELKSITWDDVDTYPLFSNCNESDTKSQQKACFETTLLKHIRKHIQKEEFISNVTISDTLLIHLEITGNSKVEIIEIEGDSLTFNSFPKLHNQLKESIKTLEKVAPALKRGVPVITRFTVPLLIQTESN